MRLRTESHEAAPAEPVGMEARADELRARVRHLERELGRVRRSRRVLMDLLWRLDRDWRRRIEVLEAENRRLWAVRRDRGPA